MSLTSSDSLQPTSALHQEETEQITGQQSRDWDRVKAIPYCREQHKHSVAQTAALFPFKQLLLEGIALTAADMNLIQICPLKNTRNNTTVHRHTSDIRRHVRLRAFSHFPSIRMEVMGRIYCPSKLIEMRYTVFPFEISIIQIL